jgi:hypothetical protein
MIAPICKRYARQVVLLAAVSLFSAAAYGQNGENKAPQDSLPAAGRPPVEQAVVPEGVFALLLAEALKLGPAKDAAQAEALLSGLGIAPESGWVSDYPITPAALGEIEASLIAAVERGKLALDKAHALRLFDDLKTQLGLDVTQASKAPPEPGLIRAPGNKAIYRYIDDNGLTHYTDAYDSVPEAYRDSVRILSPQAAPQLSGSTAEAPAPDYDYTAAPPPPDDIGSYYDEQEPPVVTYYAPPAAYESLYSWMPYPFWSTGVYFPGYFILNDFHRPVFFGRHRFFVRHHAGKSKHKHRHPSGIGSVKPFSGKGRRPPVRLAPAPRFSAPADRSGARDFIPRTRHGRRGAAARPLLPRTQPSKRPFASTSRSGIRKNRPKTIIWGTTPKATGRSSAPVVIPWNQSPGRATRQTRPRHRPMPAQRPSRVDGTSRRSFNRSMQIPVRPQFSPRRNQNRGLITPRSFGQPSSRPIPRSTITIPRSVPFRGHQGSAPSLRRGGGSFGRGSRGSSRGRR